MQYSALALAALASLATAQSSGPTTVHLVHVGVNGTQRYSPESLKANPGDLVQFRFEGGNHTVTQSTFANPCQPIGMHSNVTGFHSGFQPAAASMAQGEMSLFTVMVTDNNPIWAYCAQAKHCENGMVMVINENTSSNKTLEAYKSAAAKATTVIPSGTNTTTGGTTGTTESPSAGSGTPNTPSSAMGITTPGAVGLLAVVAAFFML